MVGLRSVEPSLSHPTLVRNAETVQITLFAPMNNAANFRYVLELFKKTGRKEHVGTFAVKPDWEPALEWARFAAVCEDPSPPVVLSTDSGAIEAALGPPCRSAILARVYGRRPAAPGGRRPCSTYP